MLQNFLRHINIQPCNVHIPNGNAENLDVECANYEQQIKAAGGIDYLLEVLGLMACSSLSSRTHIQSLTVETIRANARFFDGKLEEVPKQALTVGVGTIMDAQEVLILVNGANKAYALHKCIESGISHMWTASAFQNHPKTTFVVDEDATLELKVKTVKYFKEIYASSALEALTAITTNFSFVNTYIRRVNGQ
uniref:Glucosamine-6-phosphate deaminase n=1 Tax=Ditylenchus dipsaci TaxID=166011 RepID=A0A915D450_9BILA